MTEKEKETQPENQSAVDKDLQTLEALSNLMDNKFKIPGTDFRFGLDALIGFIPYVGDIAGFGISGYLLSMMYRKGAGVGIMLQMVGNTLLDALVGTIPFLGDIFDIGFKANRRNLDLMKKYYAVDKKRPNAKVSASIIIGVLIFLFILLLIGVWKISAYFWGWCFSANRLG